MTAGAQALGLMLKGEEGGDACAGAEKHIRWQRTDARSIGACLQLQCLELPRHIL